MVSNIYCIKLNVYFTTLTHYNRNIRIKCTNSKKNHRNLNRRGERLASLSPSVQKEGGEETQW